MRVLVAEDDNVSAKILQKTLERMGHSVEVARSGAAAWEACQAEHFPLVLSDWMMPGLEGPELCKLIRENSNGSYSYFIILTAKGQRADKLEALSAGADDFLAKPLDREELHARISVAKRILDMQGRLQEQNVLLDEHRSSLEGTNAALTKQQAELSKAHRELAQLNAKLSTLATTDALTSIPNHRAFQDRLVLLIAEAKRGRPFALAMVDVDNFKVFNDNYGHQAGDEVLIAVAKTLSCGVRETDFVARYGGEEFCVLLTDVDEEQAADLCDKLRQGIQEIVTPYSPVTASFGVSGSERAGNVGADLIGLADQALYGAKEAGRNRVMRADEALKRTAA